MSSTSQAAKDNPDAYLFLSIIYHMGDGGKPDWNKVAEDVGHAYGKNVPPKFNAAAKKFGIKYERGSFVLLDDSADAVTSPNSTTTTTVPATPKASRKKKATPKKGNGDDVTPGFSAKKRKVEEATVDETKEESESDQEDQD